MNNPFTDFVTVSDYQQFPGIGMRTTTPASSPDAWRFYQEVYNTWAVQHRFRKWDVTAHYDIDAPEVLSTVVPFWRYIANPRVGGADMQLVGEPIFDFSDRAVQALMELIKDPERKTVEAAGTLAQQYELAEWLFSGVGMMNSPLNMTLMPLVTNLRGIRSGVNIAADGGVVFGSEITRQDTFLYVLYRYYQGDDLLLRRAGADGTMLKKFLDQFRVDNNPYTSVKNFCNDIYLIRLSDRQLRDFILCGSKPLLDEQAVTGYYFDAIDWWRARAESFADDIKARKQLERFRAGSKR